MKLMPRVLLSSILVGSAFSYVPLGYANTAVHAPDHNVIQLGVLEQPLVSEPQLYAAVDIKGQGGEKAPDQANANDVRYFGPVSSADTMWSIAVKMRPDSSVSIYQTMMAIYDANPSAFENGDLHKLRNGSTLMVPPMAQMQQLSAADAQKRFNDWAQRGPQAQQEQQLQSKEAERLAALEEAKAAALAEKERLQQEKMALEQQVEKMEQVGELRSDTLSTELTQATDAVTTLRAENERLRLQLQNANKELALLKEQVGKEAVLQQKLADLLDAQRQVGELQQQQNAQMQNQGWDQWLMERQGLLALLTTLPTVLLIGVLALWLFRRNKKEEPAAESATTTTALPTDTVAVADDNMGAPEPLSDEEVAALEDVDGFDFGDEKEESLFVDDDDDLLAELGEAEAEELFGDEKIHDILDQDLEAAIELSDDEDTPARAESTEIDDAELGLDDIDSLLADFDEETSGKEEPSGKDEASIQAPSADSELELATERTAAPLTDDSSVDLDDLDALLAEAAESDEEGEEPAVAEVSEEPIEVDDIDALLAGYETDTEETKAADEAEEITSQSEAEEEIDLDDLLAQAADSDRGAESGLVDEPEDETVSESEDVGGDIDDLDALLAAAAHDESETIAVADEGEAALADDETGLDDLDALLAEAAKPVTVDDALEALEDESEQAATESVADELEDDVTVTLENELLAEEDELDALLTEAEAETRVATVDQIEDLDDLLREADLAAVPLAFDGQEEVSVEDVDLTIDDEALAEEGDEEGFTLDELSLVDDGLPEDELSFEPTAETNLDEDDITIEALAEEALEEEESSLDDVLGGLTLADDELALVDERPAPDLSYETALEDADDLDALLAEADKVDDKGLAATLSLEESTTAKPELSLEEELGLAFEADELPSDAEEQVEVDGLALVDESPLVDGARTEEDFIDIDSLMDTPENLNTGANEPYHSGGVAKALRGFSEIMPQTREIDVDDDNGLTAKLDLARAYIEIDDPEGATAILNEVIEKGTDDQRVEAQLLLSRLHQ